MRELRYLACALTVGAISSFLACSSSKNDDTADAGTSSGTSGTTSDGGNEAGSSSGTSGGDTDGGDAGDAGDGRDAGQSVSDAKLTFTGEGAKAIPLDSAYKPANIDGVPPFSSASLRILVGNDGADSVTVDTIVITGQNGTLDGEWRVSKPGSTGGDAFSLDNTAIAAGEQAEFGLFFFPYASGPRAAKVTVKLKDGTSASFIVDGRGRDNLEISTKVTRGFERVWESTADGQIATGGIVNDESDGIVYNANLRQVLDTFSRDPALVHTKADGTNAWAKVWNEPYLQESPAPDQNNETGGSADAIANGGDGHVYVVASRAVEKSNSIPGSFQALVYKANIASGAIAWAKGFRNSTFASPNDGENVTWRGAMGFAVDASLPDRVLAVGYTGSPSTILLLASSKSDGSLIYSRRININNDGLADRGFTIRTDAGGNGYIGGDENGRALLVHLTGLDTTTPVLDWARDVGTGTGSSINSLALASNGDALCSVFVGGADRDFVAARISTTGAKVWAKTWESGNDGDRNSSRVVRLRGNTLFAGGNIAVQAADTTTGDGFFLGVDADTGAYKVASLYYTGKTVTTISAHIVKGFAFKDTDVFALLDGTPGAQNANHYWGFWYQAPNDTLVLPVGDGSERLKDYPAVAPVAVTSAKLDFLQKDNADSGGQHEGTAHAIDTTPIWKDVPASVSFADAHGFEAAPKNHTLLTKQKIAD